MLFNDQFLFIHVPKTAGMSVTQFLIDTVPGKLTLTEPVYRPRSTVQLPASVWVKLQTKTMLKRAGFWGPRRVAYAEGRRHERLHEAQAFFQARGRTLDEFRLILSVVRNPYDIEVSRYHYLRKGFHGRPGVAETAEQAIALGNDFEQFALMAPFHGHIPAHIEHWYERDGCVPRNMKIARFETLDEDLRAIVGTLYPVRSALPKLNTTERGPFRDYLSPRAEAAIYAKYRWLFDKGYYCRET